MKQISMTLLMALVLGFFSGCGSSSSSTPTYDSGEATVTQTIEAGATEDPTVGAVDEKSKAEVASVTIPAAAAATEAVTVALSAESEAVTASDDVAIGANEKAASTTLRLNLTGADGEALAGETPVTLKAKAPSLAATDNATPTQAYVIQDDASASAALRGVILTITVGADGTVSFDATWKPGRSWRIVWIFEPETTGSTGASN